MLEYTTDTKEYDFDKLIADMPISNKARARIGKTLKEKINHTPTLALIGVSGTGKSSFCNKLFGQHLFKVDDVEACTKKVQMDYATFGNNKMVLYDLPGLGEGVEEDKVYADMYNSIIQKVDTVIIMLDATSRNYTPIKKFYQKHIRGEFDHKTVFIINQIDRCSTNDWNGINECPSDNQQLYIAKKELSVAGIFGVSLERVMSMSVVKNYNILNIVKYIIHNASSGNSFAFSKNLDRNIKKEVKNDAKAELTTELTGVIVDTCEETGASIGETIAGEKGKRIGAAIGRTVGKCAKKIVDKIFEWFW